MNHFTGVLRSLHMRPSMVSLNSLDKFHVHFNTQTIWAPYNTVPNNWTMTLDGSPGLAVIPQPVEDGRRIPLF